MNFADYLQSKAEDRTIQLADEFAGKVKEKLEEAADQGYKKYLVEIKKDEEHAHVFVSESFVKRLNKKLDGVEVVYEKVETPGLLVPSYKYTSHYLKFSW